MCSCDGTAFSDYGVCIRILRLFELESESYTSAYSLEVGEL